MQFKGAVLPRQVPHREASEANINVNILSARGSSPLPKTRGLHHAIEMNITFDVPC